MMTKVSGAPIDTFNIGFEGGVAVSEHREAARVAAHIGSRHHALMLAPDHVLDAFDRWIDVFDEPFADQAALPTMLLSGFARRDVTVVLTGEGADEVFGGYSNYRKRVAEERWTRWLGARGSPLPALVRGLAAGRAQGPPAALAGRAAPAALPHDPQRVRRRAASDVAVAAFLAATAGTPDVGRPRRRRVRRSRRRAVPRPPAARRHPAVAARRPADQGRPRDDDPFARGARAVPRPSAASSSARGSTRRRRSAAPRTSTS